MSMPTAHQPLLIVNADDYGLTSGVSKAILEAHHNGIVTSTSVLAIAPGFAPMARWLADCPTLGAGAHLAAVGEDPPLLSQAEIPTLVDRRGALPVSWRQLFRGLSTHRIDPDDIGREFSAQFEAITSAGIVIDHLDSHQNVHLWPSVRDVVLDLGDRRGVRVMRVTRSNSRSVVGTVVSRLARRLEAACDRRGWLYPGATTGLDHAGHLHGQAMVAELKGLRASSAASAELATHPGSADDPELSRYRWNYQWADEFDALCAPDLRHLVDELGFHLGTFADLAALR